MNENVNDWQVEMHRLLEVIGRESTLSLRKMNIPFNEEFRQHFLKMSALRLDSSFNKILFERMVTQASSSSTASVSNGDNGIANNRNDLCLLANNVGDSNALERQKVMELKVESSIDATIEITDSDDDDTVVEYPERREANDEADSKRESNVAQHFAENNDIADSVQDGIDSNVENDVEIKEKLELKSKNEDELMDLPMEVFDPNNVNENTGEKNRSAALAGSMDDENQPSTSSSSQEQAKPSNGKCFQCKHCAYTTQNKTNFQQHQLIHEGLKPFKCEHCDYAARQKIHLIMHQRTHNRQKFNFELYKCPHCDQQFILKRGLKKHLTQTHKDNQRLFNCSRCMRRFTRKSEKDRHELRCKNRLYECYLCKTYVTKRVSQLEQHMHTHTGAKPFECAVCNKRFRHKIALKRHLDSIHSRINK